MVNKWLTCYAGFRKKINLVDCMHYNTNFSQGKEDLSNRYIIIEDLLTFVRVYDTIFHA